MAQPGIAAVILAAGQGTRLKTDRPKVLHEVLGRPMLAYVIDACRAAGVQTCVVVIGYQKQQVLDAFAHDAGLLWAEQAEQKGTGHAVQMCRAMLAGRFEHSLVLCGDGPLIRAETLHALIERHRSSGAAATLATAEIDDPAGYGRIVRDAAGGLRGIVEERDCMPSQRAIREVNPSYYLYRVDDLLSSLDQVQPNNVKGEYYLTDTLSILIERGRRVDAMTSVPPQDIYSINSRSDLAFVNGVMRERINRDWMERGVTIVDPATTWIDARARIGRDTVIYPFTSISGAVQIGQRCVIGPLVALCGGEIADGQVVGGARA